MPKPFCTNTPEPQRVWGADARPLGPRELGTQLQMETSAVGTVLSGLCLAPWRRSPPLPTLSAPWEAGLYLLHPRAPLLLLRVGFWQGDGVGPGGLEGIAAGGLSLSPSPLGCPPLRSRFSSNFLDPSVPCRPPPSHLVGSGAHDSQPASSSLPGWFPLACPSLCPVSLSIPVRMARTLPRPQ